MLYIAMTEVDDQGFFSLPNYKGATSGAGGVVSNYRDQGGLQRCLCLGITVSQRRCETSSMECRVRQEIVSATEASMCILSLIKYVA